jgi:hypothetical protein
MAADELETTSRSTGSDVALCRLVDEPGPDTVLHAVDLKSVNLLWTQGGFDKGTYTEKLSWHCTPAVLDDGTVIAQAYGLRALR